MKQWQDVPLHDRARRASRALRPAGTAASVPGARDRASVVTRDLVVWLSHAGRASLTDVASLLGMSVQQVHRVLARLAPFDQAAPRNWSLMLRCRITASMQEAWYAELRSGWPWRRAGSKGNRGGGRLPVDPGSVLDATG